MRLVKKSYYCRKSLGNGMKLYCSVELIPI